MEKTIAYQDEGGTLKMKKMIVKFGNMVAALALVAASMNVNATCGWHIYQEEVPESAKKLGKVK